MELKDRIRALREEKGQTQKECAAILGVEYGTYNKWENGIAPNYETLSQLADYFNTTTDFLIGRTDEAHPQEHASFSIGVPPDFEMTSSQEEIMEYCRKFLNAIGTVAVLPNDEKQPFLDLIKNTNTMLNYALSIGKTDDLMGQTMAVDMFISACSKCVGLNSELLERAYEKLWELLPMKRPGMKITFSAGKQRSE